MRFAIVGAGITGLSIGYYLSRYGHTADIFESDDEIGGLAQVFDYRGMKIDRFYHHFYLHDTDAIQLISDLGLSEKLAFKKTPTGMYMAKKLYGLSSPLDLLRFSPLSLFDRFKMGRLVLESHRIENYSALERISAKEWICAKAGADVYKIMWEPLLKSKFGRFADSISAAWLWSKFAKRGRSRTKIGSEKLGFLTGGLSVLTGKIAKELEKAGSRIIKGAKVEKVIVENGRAQGLILKDGKSLEGYDRIVSTLATDLTAGLIESDFNEYKNSLRRIEYLGNITLVLILKRSLSELYWLNVNDPACPFVGVIEHADRLKLDEKQSFSVAYISKYLSKSDPYYALEKSEVLKQYLPWLFKIFPSFDDMDIADSFLWRADFAQPVIEKGYRDIMPAIETPIKDLFLVTMAQIFPEDRQISNAIRDAKTFAERFRK